MQGSFLYCFKDGKEMNCEEVIPLEGGAVEIQRGTEEHTLPIVITVGPQLAGSTRQAFYVLAADTPDSQVSNFSVINRCGCVRTGADVVQHMPTLAFKRECESRRTCKT